jgi:hypothetical protein
MNTIHSDALGRVCAGLVLALLAASSALAKLPTPVLSDEAKAKAAEAAAKTAHGTQVANFQLCRSMDGVAAAYFAKAKQSGKAVKEATKTDACAEPAPFVYTPPAPAVPAAAAPGGAAAPAAAAAATPGGAAAAVATAAKAAVAAATSAVAAPAATPAAPAKK